jgi:hypothetical protein
MYTEAYDDATPEQRERGMEAGHAWHDPAEVCVVYIDYGVTPGMLAGIEHFRSTFPRRVNDEPYIVERQIGFNPE